MLTKSKPFIIKPRVFHAKNLNNEKVKYDSVAVFNKNFALKKLHLPDRAQEEAIFSKI